MQKITGLQRGGYFHFYLSIKNYFTFPLRKAEFSKIKNHSLGYCPREPICEYLSIFGYI
jgi:hypothetical protein